jgi:ribulose-5-phosphate 4-epimerase/fuculose-1-phosphate aldolase
LDKRTVTAHDADHRPAHVCAEEWAARIELAAAYRIVDMLGWTELIYNHLSLRVPGPEGERGCYLINPFGLHYREVCASNLVKVDAQGRTVDSDWPVNPAGITFHGAIHAAAPEVHCVMHVHTTPTMAVCCLEEGLSFTNFYAAQLWGQVAYHTFEGITVHADEGARIVAAARNGGGFKPVLLLRNHGPVVMGPTVAATFARLWVVQRACEVQVAAQPLGRLERIPVPVMERCVADSLVFRTDVGQGQDGFDALRRLLDRQDPSYRG